MFQVPSIEQYRELAALVQTLEKAIEKLESQIDSTSHSKPWYTAKEVKDMYSISDDRTIRGYEKNGLLTRQQVGNKKLYSAEEVFNLPFALEQWKKSQV